MNGVRWAVLALLVATGSLAAAQDELPMRGNRREGIVNATNVSGYRLELIGVTIKPELQLDTLPEELRLAALAPSGTKLLRVRVDEIDTHYRMEPLLAESPSLETRDCDEPLRPSTWFCWPTTDVIEPSGVPIARLVATASDHDGRYYPVSIAPGEQLPAKITYVFALRVVGELPGTWEILRAEGGKPVDAKGPRPLPLGPSGVMRVEWDPPTDLVKGLYRFKVNGTRYTEDEIQPVRLEKQFFFDPHPELTSGTRR